MPAGVVIREMRESDLDKVMRLDALCLPVPWSATVWKSELTSPLGLHLVAEREGEIVAQIGAKRVLDELHVTTIAVLPERRRRGLARDLIATASQCSPEARLLTLEVRSKNPGARAFYKSLGFHEIGVRPRYYGDDDAVVMTLRRPPPE
ncbi:MAG: ribosomal protein S18-alanine N-acetyltransferase [Rubrobacter sp.]